MNQVYVRQSAQALITAYVQRSNDLDLLIKEAAEDHPEEMLLCLASFVDAHTARVNKQVSDVRAVLHYVVHTVLAGLREIGRLRGGDPHEFLRLHLEAFSEDEDRHVKAAQVLLAAASSEGLNPAYEVLLDRCAPAYGRVSSATIDIWLTASLDALDTCRPEPLLRLLLHAVQLILQALADFSGVDIEEMLQAYWTRLIELDCAS